MNIMLVITIIQLQKKVQLMKLCTLQLNCVRRYICTYRGETDRHNLVDL